MANQVAIDLKIQAKLGDAKKQVKELVSELEKMDSVGKKGGTDPLNKSIKETIKALSTYQKSTQATSDQSDKVASSQTLFSKALSLVRKEANRAAGSLGGLGRVTGGLSTHFVSAVNPLTLAAAAAASLAVSYVAGEKESTAYNQALITTGNAAGKTASQLQTMASTISSGVGSQRQAAQAIQALVSTGQGFGGDLQKYAESAVRAQRDLGQSVEQTVANFEQLGRSPVQASLALNERMNYLTVAVLDQIRALEEQGRTQEAATLAMNTYANAVSDRSSQVVQNLGTIEKAWRSVKEVSEAAVDGLMSIGREDTLQKAGSKVIEQIGKLQTQLKNLESVGLGSSHSANLLRKDLRLLQVKREDYEWQVGYEDRLKRQEEERVRIQNEGAKASESWAQASAQYLGNEERMNQELKKQAEYIKAIAAAGGQVPSAEEQAKVEAGIRARYIQKPAAAKPDQVKAAYEQQEIAMITQLLQAQNRLENAQNGIADSQTAATDALNIWLQTNEHAKSIDQERVATLRALASEVDATTAALQSSAEDKARAERITSGLSDMQIQWLQATGQAAEASALQIEERFKELRADLEAIGNVEGLQMLDSLSEVQRAQVELQQLQQRAQQALITQAQEEQSIQLRLQSGLITEFESRRQILTLHQATADEIDSLLPKMQALSEVTGSEDSINRVKELALQMQQLRLQTNEVQLAFESTFEDQLVTALDSIIDNTKSVLDALNDFLVGMVKDMGRWAARELAMEAKSGIASLLSSGASAAGEAAGKTAEAAASTAATTSLAAMSTTATATTAALGAFTAALMTAAAAQSSQAASSGISAIAGAAASSFASGGFTGVGGKYQPAGIVHAGEYVMPQEFLKQPGALSLLEALHINGMGALSGFKGYASGGLVVGEGMPTYQPSEAKMATGNTTVENKMDLFLIDDPNRLAEAMATRQGNKVYVATFKKNIATFRQLLNQG